MQQLTAVVLLAAAQCSGICKVGSSSSLEKDIEPLCATAHECSGQPVIDYGYPDQFAVRVSPLRVRRTDCGVLGICTGGCPSCWGQDLWLYCNGTVCSGGEWIALPTASPATSAPTAAPSRSPSAGPIPLPSSGPTRRPSASPSLPPTAAPSSGPTLRPSAAPTLPPTSAAPTSAPTVPPTVAPTAAPSVPPSVPPSAAPSTTAPSGGPSLAPTAAPSAPPSAAPTSAPSRRPSAGPSVGPTAAPSAAPSAPPSAEPSAAPSASPTAAPSAAPTAAPSTPPSAQPSAAPASQSPTAAPSHATASPSVQPTRYPTQPPSPRPSTAPTEQPTSAPVGTDIWPPFVTLSPNWLYEGDLRTSGEEMDLTIQGNAYFVDELRGAVGQSAAGWLLVEASTNESGVRGFAVAAAAEPRFLTVLRCCGADRKTVTIRADPALAPSGGSRTLITLRPSAIRPRAAVPHLTSGLLLTVIEEPDVGSGFAATGTIVAAALAVATVSPMSASAVPRVQLLLRQCSGAGDDFDDVDWVVYPLRVKLAGSRRLGALLLNPLLLAGVLLLAWAATKAVRAHSGRSELSAQAALRYPSVASVPLPFLGEGVLFAAVHIILEPRGLPGGWVVPVATIGCASFVGVLAVITKFLSSALAAAPADQQRVPDVCEGMPSRCKVWLWGSASWVDSDSRQHTARHGLVFEDCRYSCRQFYAVELATLVPVTLISCFSMRDMVGCATINLLNGVVLLTYCAVTAYLRPWLPTFLHATNCLLTALQAAGCLIIAACFFARKPESPGISVGGYCFAGSLVVLLGQLAVEALLIVIDVVDGVVGRVRKQRASRLDNSTEMLAARKPPSTPAQTFGETGTQESRASANPTPRTAPEPLLQPSDKLFSSSRLSTRGSSRMLMVGTRSPRMSRTRDGSSVRKPRRSNRSQLEADGGSIRRESLLPAWEDV